MERKGKMPEYVHGKRMKKVSSPFVCYGDFEDLAGQKFNRWTVIKRTHNNQTRRLPFLASAIAAGSAMSQPET